MCLDSIKVRESKMMTLHFDGIYRATHIGECETLDFPHSQP
ncbi:hypothetical protein OQH61_04485 [Helicobacter sp. MIT 21-1697]|nr:hypothetical protein [Helicobacter sp. MIT 21-1697]MCX2716990.1 hypothetical protein [Helicobacter sp. MIT 21-1697]